MLVLHNEGLFNKKRDLQPFLESLLHLKNVEIKSADFQSMKVLSLYRICAPNRRVRTKINKMKL